MAEKQKHGGKKGRKIGRNKSKCERYQASGRRERNKVARLRRHCTRHPADAVAARTLAVLS
jgi:hypothetical protein